MKWIIIIQLILIKILLSISHCLIRRQLSVYHISVKIFRNDSWCCRAYYLTSKSLVFLIFVIFYWIVWWLLLILIKCMWCCCFFLNSASILISIIFFCLQFLFSVFSNFRFILLKIEFFKNLIICFNSFHIFSIIFHA